MRYAEIDKSRHKKLEMYSMKKDSKIISKKKAVLDRIKHIKEAILKSHEYLETGKHENWHGFRPLFNEKVKDGKTMPPHKDWVKNVFLPENEKALKLAEEKLEKLND